MEQLKDIERIIDERLAEGNDHAFYVLDIEDVKLKYQMWIEKMPRVVPYYAVKCNDDERVLKTLFEAGAGFDCASMKELKQVLDLGVKPEKIIYAHTAKQVSHLRFAAKNQVTKMTFDSPAELKKIKEFYPLAEVVLRIRFDAKNSIVCLGLKFGCDPITEAPSLIKMCKEMGLNLIGVSFHIGSGTTDFETFEQALASVRQVFNVASDFGFQLNLVDIGGGFMGYDKTMLVHYAKFINSGIEKYFPDTSIQIISEPGRYFVESAFTLVTQVMLKKTLADGHINYYINEGIFMSFNMKFIDKVEMTFRVLRKSKTNSKHEEKISTIWGSSCNSKDKIIESRLMPEFEINDWIVFDNMGAYSTVCATSFNGFKIGETLLT